MAIEMIDELIEWGRIPPVVVADAGYGDTTAFRLALTERGIDYVVAVKGATSAHPGDAVPETAAYSGRGRPSTPRYGPHTTCKDLVLAAGRKSLRTVTWRKGSKTDPTNPTASMRSRFAVLRVRPANRDIPRAEDGTLPAVWLLAEWPTGADEPTDYWLSTLPEDTPLPELVRLAKIRWRVEHDYRELKTGLGLDHFEGRSWLGFVGRNDPPSLCQPDIGSPYPCSMSADPGSIRADGHQRLPNLAAQDAAADPHIITTPARTERTSSCAFTRPSHRSTSQPRSGSLRWPGSPSRSSCTPSTLRRAGHGICRPRSPPSGRGRSSRPSTPRRGTSSAPSTRRPAATDAGSSHIASTSTPTVRRFPCPGRWSPARTICALQSTAELRSPFPQLPDPARMRDLISGVVVHTTKKTTSRLRRSAVSPRRTARLPAAVAQYVVAETASWLARARAS